MTTAVLERERIEGAKKNVKGHGRHHAISNLSINSQGNLDYLLPPCAEKREHAAKQGGASNFFQT